MPRLPKQCNMDLDQNEHEINLFFEEFPKKTLFHRWRDVSWKGLNLLVMELVPLCPALPLSILWQCSKPGNQDDDGAHEDMYIYYDDTWYMIHDTWYMIHDTWYMIHDTWYIIHMRIQIYIMVKWMYVCLCVAKNDHFHEFYQDEVWYVFH